LHQAEGPLDHRRQRAPRAGRRQRGFWHLATPRRAQTAAAGAKALITTHQTRQPSLFLTALINRQNRLPRQCDHRVKASPCRFVERG